MKKELSLELKRSAAWTAILTILFLLFTWSKSSYSEVFIALPFFILLYFLFCSIGRKETTRHVRSFIHSELRKALIFPALLLFIYFFYVLINNQSPFRGMAALLPYLLFPILLFLVRKNRNQKIDWIDFTAFVLYLLPTLFIKVEPAGNLPFRGEDFDSVYRIAMILSAIYAFGILRNLEDIGFYPTFNLNKLGTALWVWVAFYLFVLVIGFNVNFIKYVGHDAITSLLIRKIAVTLVVTFLHTAIFEELFFRGILLNMLTKRIARGKNWMIFLVSGLVVLLPLAFLVGYTLKGGMQWFPALMTLLIFAAAYLIEKRGKTSLGVYTALAITSTIFGLVHYHSGAIVYIGFACVAGWAYGYTYIKTKNVFYSALVHTLVNSSVLIFGLEFIK